ncbi:hypothetical protein HS088_TW06G00761 [Tripterygium wilfordii]|uniref:Uncharacterized protein n=1 Tax=Tripterygium wilfordii TaxID=458696 RepID=A0A7J7DJP2_TRIWF|nr:hypothetical protein HS088_TW06G00761 [Tripterygium wilfordii]
MMSLWKKAIESSNALLLDEIGLGSHALLKVVEEFDTVSQTTEHSYPALISSRNEDGTCNPMAAFFSNSPTNDYCDDYIYNEEDDDYECYDNNSFEYLIQQSLSL